MKGTYMKHKCFHSLTSGGRARLLKYKYKEHTLSRTVLLTRCSIRNLPGNTTKNFQLLTYITAGVDTSLWNV